MTSLPAQRERLSDRGLLKEGYFADITVFDANSIEDTATYTKPDSLSKGVAYVFVNGQLEFENGKLTGSYGRTRIARAGLETRRYTFARHQIDASLYRMGRKQDA